MNVSAVLSPALRQRLHVAGTAGRNPYGRRHFLPQNPPLPRRLFERSFQQRAGAFGSAHIPQGGAVSV